MPLGCPPQSGSSAYRLTEAISRHVYRILLKVLREQPLENHEYWYLKFSGGTLLNTILQIQRPLRQNLWPYCFVSLADEAEAAHTTYINACRIFRKPMDPQTIEKQNSLLFTLVTTHKLHLPDLKSALHFWYYLNWSACQILLEPCDLEKVEEVVCEA
jgi:hypothetical protein